MDIPALIILCAALVALVTICSVRSLRLSRSQALTTLLCVIGGVWIITTFIGEFVFGAGNSECSKYLGCVNGFFGYDAFEHLFFGITAALVIMWVSDRFPKLSLRGDRRWKTALTIVAIVALISVLWEIGECVHDTFSVDVLHETLFNFRLHIDLLAQSSNLDTMGDLTFALAGSIVAVFL